ncbi:sensor histidine kinase [Clostridium vincentii]|uniref:Sensory histidine kinase DcuS n=1 Tax=Clostridium vincentii TaxID=52704 RepID=A0A2T0BI02_9CLOT|nr:sensor histidine kinase [Clostridium vincentii]PRR83473.1 sensory histidine kinase DcuS [Clostridium vincentii]
MYKFEVILYLASNVFYMFMIYKFINIYLLKCKVTHKKIIACYILYYAIVSIAYLKIEIPIITLTSNIIMTLIICMLYEGSWKDRLWTMIILHTMGMISELLVVYGMQCINYINETIFIEQGVNIIWEIVYSKLLLFIILRVFENYKKKRTASYISNVYWWYIFLVPVSSIGILNTLFRYSTIENNEVPIYITTGSVVAILVINMVIFHLHDKIINKYEMETQNRLLEEKNNYYIHQYDQEEYYKDKIRRLSHDMKNHLICVQTLAGKGQINEIKSYVENLLVDNDILKSPIDSGNMVIDAILGYKISYAAQYDIDVKLDLQIPQGLLINDPYICTILGNSLDNAIEACMQQVKGKKSIKIAIAYLKTNIFISIINTHQGNIKVDKNKKIITGKENANNHGLGLKSIKRAVEKCNGELIIEYTKEIFELNVLLYYII